MAKTDLTAQRLRELLHYDSETGAFTRLVITSRNSKVGDIAGSKDAYGYLSIMVDGTTYKSHRLAWLYVYGLFPDNQIDHINGNKADNRIDNLRDVSQNLNQHNQRTARVDNKSSGLLGVSRSSRNRNGFEARINIDGKNRHLGTFQTPEAAHAAYLAAKRQLHEGCTI